MLNINLENNNKLTKMIGLSLIGLQEPIKKSGRWKLNADRRFSLNLTSQNNTEGPSLHSTVSSSWKALIKYLGAVLLTVKPIPTVAAKFPGWNLPVSNWTNNEVLPTPLSPRRIVCEHTREWTLDYKNFNNLMETFHLSQRKGKDKCNLYLDHESLGSSLFD